MSEDAWSMNTYDTSSTVGAILLKPPVRSGTQIARTSSALVSWRDDHLPQSTENFVNAKQLQRVSVIYIFKNILKKRGTIPEEN